MQMRREFDNVSTVQNDKHFYVDVVMVVVALSVTAVVIVRVH